MQITVVQNFPIQLLLRTRSKLEMTWNIPSYHPQVLVCIFSVHGKCSFFPRLALLVTEGSWLMSFNFIPQWKTEPYAQIMLASMGSDFGNLCWLGRFQHVVIWMFTANAKGGSSLKNEAFVTNCGYLDSVNKYCYQYLYVGAGVLWCIDRRSSFRDSTNRNSFWDTMSWI